jgi:hypothetical protein
MAYSNVLTLDQVLQALYEDKGIFNLCNRNYDAFITEPGGNTAYIPAVPLLEAVTPPATNRKYTGADTDMIPVAMASSVVEVGQEVDMKYKNKSGAVMQGFIQGVSKAHRKNFDAKVIKEAQDNGTVINWAGAVLQWDDFMAIDAMFDTLEVDGDDRFIVYPSRLKTQVQSIDVIKTAMAHNPNYLEKGILQVANMRLISSARVATIGGKENLVGIWGPGLAFLLDSFMDREEAYDTTNKRTDVDYFAWYGKKLLNAYFAVINKQN